MQSFEIEKINYLSFLKLKAKNFISRETLPLRSNQRTSALLIGYLAMTKKLKSISQKKQTHTKLNYKQRASKT